MSTNGSRLKDEAPPRSDRTQYFNNRIENSTTWDSTNHEFGSCLVNHKKKLIYVHIPKCASTWMKAFLDQGSDRKDWVNDNFVKFDHSKYQLIIILRDPVDRWYSAMPGNNVPLGEDTCEKFKQTFNNFSQWFDDEHSVPQTDFLVGLNLSRATFFKCDESLSITMKKFLSEYKLKHYLSPEYKNSHADTNEYQVYKSIWQQLFDDEKYFKIFKNAYKKDYDLINSIKFYGHN